MYALSLLFNTCSCDSIICAVFRFTVLVLDWNVFSFNFFTGSKKCSLMSSRPVINASFAFSPRDCCYHIFLNWSRSTGAGAPEDMQCNAWPEASKGCRKLYCFLNTLIALLHLSTSSFLMLASSLWLRMHVSLGICHIHTYCDRTCVVFTHLW